jgi:hypothetical protein
MLNYYDVIAKQDHADRIASVGYQMSAAARREVSQEAVARHLNQQHHAEQEEKQAARRMALANCVNAVKAIFRSRTALVR